MYGYIYKTVNLQNNKIYVGQKKSDTFLHEKYLGSGVRLHSAIEHYGKECFQVILIDTAFSKEDLDNKEIFWINFLDATDPYVGYNLSKGGDGNNTGTSWNKGLTKDVCPKLIQSEITKQKRSESLKKAYIDGRHKVNLSDESREVMREKARNREHPPTTNGRICVTDGVNNKMILPDDLELYESKGYYKGKTIKNKKPAWNKGLTKETDDRVSKYTDSRNALIKSGKQIGFVNCPNNHFSKGQKVKEYKNSK